MDDDDVFDNFGNNPPKHGEEDGEEQLEPKSDDLLDQAEGSYAETTWIDDDVDYNAKDSTVVREVGNKDNIQRFINRMITKKGTISRSMSEWKRKSTVKFIRSFLALTDGGNIRPRLNNDDGLRIIHGSTSSRGGSVKLGGLTTTLSYNGVDVRKINTSKLTISKLNVNSPAEVEFSGLVTSVFRTTSGVMESVADETGISGEVVTDVVDEYPEHTPEMIESMVREKNKHYKAPEPGEKIDMLMKIINDTTIFDGTGNDPISLPDIPGSVAMEIAESSVSEISERLHERVGELTELELREFTGMLDPKGDVDTKIEALDLLANEYRLKVLRETNPRKEQLYRNIRKTAELKSDLIRIVEKGEAPEHSEARAVFEEEVDGNESIEDLSRLERFREWMKENWLGATALAVTVASLITTVIIGMRSAIKEGANAAGSFGQSVYDAFRKLAKRLGPVLGPVVTAVGSLIVTLLKYGALGLAWLASNLWVLVVALVWLVYDRYGKK